MVRGEMSNKCLCNKQSVNVMQHSIVFDDVHFVSPCQASLTNTEKMISTLIIEHDRFHRA